MSHRMKTVLTRPPVPCLTWIVSCQTRRGPEFQARFGPQTFNLMSLDSNCRRGRDRRLLPYSSGVNVFAQTIQIEHNVYVFPPAVLVGPLLGVFFFISTPMFRFYCHCPSFTTASLLMGNTPSYGSRFFSYWEER